MAVRILVADDHEIVREGIRTLIARSKPQWKICGEARNGEEAVEAAKNLKPDVIILDITMPKVSGLEAATKIASLDLGIGILMFTMHDSERLHAEARQARAQGVVLKSQAARDLIRAIDALLAGGTFFESEATQNSSAGGRPRGSSLEPGLGHRRDRLTEMKPRLLRMIFHEARTRRRVERQSTFSSHSPYWNWIGAARAQG
ncbi:MAG TPA: response regulator transcription factor [Terriglobales bacterium]|nr:response regulator transcription factor [Terriglobales bacterium]